MNALSSSSILNAIALLHIIKRIGFLKQKKNALGLIHMGIFPLIWITYMHI